MIMAAARIAKGTFTRNTHRQSRASVRTPPTSGPRAVPTVETKTTAPIARGRTSSSKAFPTTAMLVGKRVAAPTPWSTRQATSMYSS